MDRDNRVKIYRFDERLALRILRGLANVLCVEWPKMMLPYDAEIVQIHYEWSTRCWEVMVWSSTFELAPPGERPPYVPGVLDSCTLMLKPIKCEAQENQGDG